MLRSLGSCFTHGVLSPVHPRFIAASHGKAFPPRWIFGLLLAFVALFPLTLGGIYQWSWAGLAVLVGGLLLAWVVSLWRRPDTEVFWPRGEGPFGLMLPLLLLVAVLAWAALQAASFGVGQATIWATTAEHLGVPVAGSLSLAPEKTRAALLQLMTAGAVFWLAVQYGRSPELVRCGLWVLAVAGLCYCLYGLAMVLSGSDKVLWFAKTRYLGNVTGPYINRNLFAFYAGLGLLASCALLLDRVAAAQRPDDWLLPALRRALLEQPNRVAALVTMILIYLVTIGFTESRGGALSSAFAVAILLVAMLLRSARLGPRSLLLGSAGAVAIWLLVYAVTAAHLGGRFQSEFFEDGGRLDAYGVMLTAIGDAPLQGYGYGAFAESFFYHNDGSIWPAYNYSHNLYLGAVVELGLPAACALLMAVALVTLACVRGLRKRRRHQAYPALGLGITTLVAAHGLVDSPLFIPANAVTYSCLLGLAYAQAFPTQRAAWK